MSKKRFKELTEEVKNYIQDKIWGVPDVTEEVGIELAVHCLNLVNGAFFQTQNWNKAVDLSKTILTLDEIRGETVIENDSNLVYLLHKIGRNDESKHYAEQLIKKFEEMKKEDSSIQLNSSDFWYNYACTLKDLSLYKESAEAFRKSIDCDPEFAMTHYHLANVLYALGEYKEAMAEDEWRFDAHSGLGKFRRRFTGPLWDGSTGKGKTIIVFSEQGYGDALMFARYLKKLKSIFSTVILEIQENLHDLFAGFPYVDKVIARDEAESKVPSFPPYDYAVSINSLPFYLDLGYENTPMEFPYIKPNKRSDSIKVDLSDIKDKKVGLLWAGSQWHTSDKTRSCFLKEFAPLFEIPGIQFVNLQAGPMQRSWCEDGTVLWEGTNDYQIVNLLENADNLIPKIIDHMPESKNFNDTALILDQLDLIITVDTAILHLAGAMNKPTWLLLPFAHEWRWLRSWYDSVEYFRQPAPGDWSGLMKEIKGKLENMLSTSI